ncbi:MAG: hypothetical protein HY819_05715 [Acidobacteria bacterium]|nr:hypothetical protein [Acidobacteriota bacterium]
MSNKKFRKKPSPFDLKNKLKPKPLPNYEISHEPVEDESLKTLPQNDRERVNQLYALIQKNPQQVVEELSALKEKYPAVPVLGNYLYVAYTLLGDEEKSDAMMLENYQRHPDYLFAKLTYGQYLLKQDKVVEFEQVFENKFDLFSLYPKRKKYHIAEVISFWGVIGLYYCAVNKWDDVAQTCQVLDSLAPHHQVTKILKTRLDQARQIVDLSQTINIAHTLAGTNESVSE